MESVDLDANKWQRLLLVLTADCDFAHGKHHGRVTCVPILDSRDYILEFRLPDVRASYSKKPLAAFESGVSNAGAAEVSRSRLIEWVHEASTEDIVRGLGIVESKAVEMSRHIDALRILHSTHESLDAGIGAYAAAIELTGLVKSREEGIARVKSDVRNSFTKLPGDAMFLGSVGPGNTDGYCAYLRHIEQVWESEVALTPNVPKATHRRLARLQDRFADAIAQQFGMVFMSIGLPTDYEDARRRHADTLGEGIS